MAWLKGDFFFELKKIKIADLKIIILKNLKIEINSF